MARTTIKTLRWLVYQLNETTGNPTEVWTRQGNNNVAHVGAYVLDAAYGGYRLCRIVTEGGGERDITPRQSAGECATSIRAYTAGVQTHY